MKFRLTFCAFVLLFAGQAFDQNALAANYGDISVQYVPLCSPVTAVQATTHGMIEHRFQIQNRSVSATRTVAIQLKSDGDYGLRNAVGSVEVPAGQTARIAILQPPVPMNSIDAVVRINGYTQAPAIRIDVPGNHCDPYSMVSHGSPGYAVYYSSGIAPGGMAPSNAHILVSVKTSTAFRDLFSKGVEPKGTDPSTPAPATFDPGMGMPGASMGMGGGMGGGMGSMGAAPGAPVPTPVREISLWRSEGDVDQWSDNWLALTRFDAIVVTDQELATIPMTQPIGKALRRYVECGGMLCVLGTEWTPPKEWKEKSTSSDSTQWDALVGSAFLLKKPAESSEDAVTSIRNQVLERSDYLAGAMRGDYYGGGGFFSDPRSLVEALPTSDSKGVPVRAISILIIVFAILIGPVNVFVLSWKNRRIWLLWTVPVISLLASGLVLGTNFSQEGFVRNASVSSVTILDQRCEEAISFGLLGFYCTLTPRGGCLFENGTEPTIITNRNRQTYELASFPGGDQNLTRGWIQPRVPAYFGVRKAATDLRRLEFQWEAQPPTVVNQLGVDLEKLIVCSPDGTFYETEKIAAGEKTALIKFATAPTNRPIPIDLVGQSQIVRTVLRFENWSRIAETLLREPTQILEPGSYIVSLGEEGNPFLEPGIDDVRAYQNKSVIVGFY